MKEFIVTVKNRLSEGQPGRNISVFNGSSGKETIVCYRDDEKFSAFCGDVDSYMNVSITHGPGDLTKWCWIELPLNKNFSFQVIPPPGENRPISTSVSGSRTILAMPPGSANWHLTVKGPHSMTDDKGYCRGKKGKDNEDSLICEITLYSVNRDVTPGDNGPPPGSG